MDRLHTLKNKLGKKLKFALKTLTSKIHDFGNYTQLTENNKIKLKQTDFPVRCSFVPVCVRVALL